ncbi:hypothetical protein [Burkholderia pseudomallei]|uniref:hypothetical protein n=1 Tax=Burkholderia pseudomallei TaxID=28450 RepID=UPI000976CCE5|nr:hypothetical protein [Burkholderia pseudomallei]ONC97874.1 hypothetical protein AQ926_18020 [Burkholderia pseudomallei]ONC98802.1 hypothetical protein AQ925_02985 [Burkholderia pseudomallei]OND10161.1 hypothetical protein AQ927_22445 [Burkholderia pseudomallei]OND15755.1 hypothetical protein AQ928_23445 [Burkholderia pseudomallei]OND19794.1 hypothetical protein AQ930_17695 [Burkholderia pseudomallei]
MRLLRLASELFYIATSLLAALPAFVYSSWGGKFLHSGAALAAMVASVAWVAGGTLLLSKWRRSRDRDMRKLIASVAPSFRPQVEIADYLSTRYVGIDAVMGKAVVIDREKNVAKYEPITYIQNAEVSDAGDTVHSAFTFSFRDFTNPSMQIRVNRLGADDISARIRYALEHAA